MNYPGRVLRPVKSPSWGTCITTIYGRSADRSSVMLNFVLNVLLWVAVFGAYLVAAVGLCWALFKERRNSSSDTRRTDDLRWWAELPTESQEEADNAALEMGAQADIDARTDAAEMAEHLVHRAQINALNHF